MCVYFETQMKSMPASQRQSLNVHRPQRILKEASVSSQKQVCLNQVE